MPNSAHGYRLFSSEESLMSRSIANPRGNGHGGHQRQKSAETRGPSASKTFPEVAAARAKRLPRRPHGSPRPQANKKSRRRWQSGSNVIFSPKRQRTRPWLEPHLLT